MRFATLIACALACTLAPAALPVAALAAPLPAPHRSEPPDQKDPCSQAGRDTCATTGVGYWKTYRYGIRWFGDYRGAVSGEKETFCIDLRWWYPAARYRYRRVDAVGLRNRDGRTVSNLNLQRMAYAVERFGRSSSPNQQAAVMLYVHHMMGDERAGEIDPKALGAKAASLYATIDRAATRYHGPYRLEKKVAGALRVGKRGSVTFRVLAASGRAVPNLALTLTPTGAYDAPRRVTTNAAGVATVRFTPTAATGFSLRVTTASLPSTFPRVYAATTAKAKRNAQRLVAPDRQRLSDGFTLPVAKAQIGATTAATPAVLLAGGTSTDRLTITGASPVWGGDVQVQVFGPFATREAIACDGTPAFRSTVAVVGSGTVTTAPVTIPTPGWYGYQEIIPGDVNTEGLTTPCDDAAEQFRVEAQPAVTTVVSATTVAPGTPLTDTITVTGLHGQGATVNAALYGPFASREAIVCTGTPVWSGTVSVTGDGDYVTAPTTITTPGFYTYHETIAATGFVRAATATCADVAETTLLKAAPAVVTQVSATTAAPGASITDRVTVTGLGAIAVTVNAELFGPFPTLAAIDCSGTPYWTGSFPATHDGDYTTEAVTLRTAGYYTYHESIAPGPANAGVSTPCAETTETTFVQSSPTIRTNVSNEVVRPGASITDRIVVGGLDRTPARIDVDLYGPFATRAAIRCGGTPVWSGHLDVTGDGTFSSAKAKVARVGFYSYRERIAGSPLVKAVTTECADAAETSLGAPAITTGRGDVARYVRASSAGAPTPARVQIAALGISAPIAPVGIDLTHGVLGVPTDVHRTGWWRDGQAPGAAGGSILIAGHVDSAAAGAGAFFALHNARAGQIVQVLTAGGRTFRYRVTSVKSYRKPDLPLSIWSRAGPARLVLVTCGGPFDQAAGHYRDDIVVTAVPA
jgi:hypothetical protein